MWRLEESPRIRRRHHCLRKHDVPNNPVPTSCLSSSVSPGIKSHLVLKLQEASSLWLMKVASSLKVCIEIYFKFQYTFAVYHLRWGGRLFHISITLISKNFLLVNVLVGGVHIFRLWPLVSWGEISADKVKNCFLSKFSYSCIILKTSMRFL